MTRTSVREPRLAVKRWMPTLSQLRTPVTHKSRRPSPAGTDVHDRPEGADRVGQSRCVRSIGASRLSVIADSHVSG